MSWLEDLKTEREVMKLRREALNVARKLIEEDPASKGMTPEEIELAACDLCDRQMKELQPTGEKEQHHVNSSH